MEPVELSVPGWWRSGMGGRVQMPIGFYERQVVRRLPDSSRSDRPPFRVTCTFYPFET